MRTTKQKKPKNKGFCEIFGIHAVEAAILNPKRTHQVLYLLKDKKGFKKEKFTKFVPEIKELKSKEMYKMFGSESTHQGIVLKTSNINQPSIDEIIHNSKNNSSEVIVLLDQITDQNNIGSIMRSCAMFNCKSIITSKDNAPELSANIAKAASGAIEIVNYISVVNLARTLNKFKKNDYWVFGFDNNENYNQKIDIPKKCVLVFGSEGKGLRNLTKKECDALISIPTKKQSKYNIDSLNVSNACAIALFEHYRKNE